MTLKSELDKLAKTIRERAAEKDTPFAEAVDALKALTGLYAIFLKDKGKPEDESDGFTMADAQTAINKEQGHNGEGTVRSGRGRSSRAGN